MDLSFAELRNFLPSLVALQPKSMEKVVPTKGYPVCQSRQMTDGVEEYAERFGRILQEGHIRAHFSISGRLMNARCWDFVLILDIHGNFAQIMPV